MSEQAAGEQATEQVDDPVTQEPESRPESRLDSGLIELTITDKPNSRLQKCHLTDRGKALLK